MQIAEMRNRYIQLLGEKNKTQKNYDSTLEEYSRLQKRYDKALIAQSLIQKAAQNTQERLKYPIEKIVTTAIESVFGEENTYEFKLEFSTKNDKTFAEPVFYQNGEDYNGTADLGGSIVDVGALAARIALWTLGGNNKTDPIFLLDESLKHLSEAFRDNASLLLKELCDKLGIQIIISTHLPVLREEADNKIHVKKVRGVSTAVSEGL